MQAITAGTTAVISLQGELDATSRPVVEKALLALEAEDAQRIVVDLRGLEFIDSSGIGLFAAALRRAEEGSHQLQFVPSHTDELQRTFEICGLDRVIRYIDPKELPDTAGSGG
jgi:anti-sigma B factor antagonist